MTPRLYTAAALILIALMLLAAPASASPTDPPDPTATTSETTKAPDDSPTRIAYPPMETTGLEKIETRYLDVWTVPAAKKAMTHLSVEVEADLKRIREYLGTTSNIPIRVVVLESINHYFDRRHEPARAPKWAVGLALSAEDTVLVMWGRGPGGQWVDLKATLVHELAHIELERAIGDRLSVAHGVGQEQVEGVEPSASVIKKERRVPRWLHEGFAIWAAGEWSLERSQALVDAGIGGKIIPLTHLRNGFPPSGPSVQLAYAQSYSFLQHLRERYGADAFRVMVGHMRGGASFDDAFAKAYDRNFPTEEAAWRQDMEVSYGWLPTVLGSTAAMSLGGIILVFAWRRRRKIVKARMAQMGESERPADILPPLPGFGLTEMDVRARPWRVLRDGSVLPRRHDSVAIEMDDDEDDEPMFFPDDEIIIGEDGIPRTPEGFTIH